MKSETVLTPSIFQPEYVIYAFASTEGKKGSAPWHRIGTLPDETQAKERARSIFGSGECSRIEVRRRLLDPKTGMMSDDPVAVLRQQSVFPLERVFVPATLAMLCAGIALYFTMFVN
ncbi:MAG: hypothetical protein JNN09_07965 [Alphaproteobacteria bacterium]|nr:hypothetical protein [Alphaproteobacteria bacterium]